MIRKNTKEMTLDAAETVLGLFGFGMAAYSNFKVRRKWRWYEELREESKRHRNRGVLMLREKKSSVYVPSLYWLYIAI
jgi:hypothetical protein